MKDSTVGAHKAWGEQLAELNRLAGGVVAVEAPPEKRTRRMRDAEPEVQTYHTYHVHTDLTVCVDLCAERDLGGVIGAGCHCQGHGMLHRFPERRREQYTTIEQALEWCAACEEPTLEEQDALSHTPCPGEELPRPCPCCDFYHGTPAQSRVQYAAESARYETLASAALESTQGQRAFDAAQLKHAHEHRKVRWRARGQPAVRVPKEKWWLELLHTVALNAIKVMLKHNTTKYMPGAP
jgi:hypothetical protein